MLFMVIEQFENDGPKPVGHPLRERGRLLPEGVNYHASGIHAQDARCFQVMGAPNRDSLDPWIAAWVTG